MNEVQGSQEWHNARLGKVTASRINDVLSWTKKGESVTRARYRDELVKQRTTGEATSIPVNSHMQRGLDFESVAREMYQNERNVSVQEVGFINHPTIEMSGASPDGCIGEDGLIEIKCPTEPNHLATIVNGEAPTRYFSQIQWQLSCTGRDWCDFVSLCLDAPAGLELFIVRVYRSDDWIKDTESAVVVFLAEVDNQFKKIKGE